MTSAPVGRIGHNCEAASGNHALQPVILSLQPRAARASCRARRGVHRGRHRAATRMRTGARQAHAPASHRSRAGRRGSHRDCTGWRDRILTLGHECARWPMSLRLRPDVASPATQCRFARNRMSLRDNEKRLVTRRQAVYGPGPWRKSASTCALAIASIPTRTKSGVPARSLKK
jgi:hypothetical protein